MTGRDWHPGPQHEVKDKKQKRKSTKKAAQSKVVATPIGDLGDTEAPDAANGPIDIPQANVASKQPEDLVPAQDNRPPAAEAAAEPAAEASLPMADNGDAAAPQAEADALPSGTEVQPKRKKKKRSKKRQRESEDHAVAAQPQPNDDSQASLKPTKKKHKSVKVGLCSGDPGCRHTFECCTYIIAVHSDPQAHMPTHVTSSSSSFDIAILLPVEGRFEVTADRPKQLATKPEM